MTDDRTRTITWSSPAIYATRGDLSGLELLQAIQRGELPPPPIAKLLDMRIVEVEKGRVLFELVVAEFHYSPLNMVHGGVAAALLDTVMGCAVQAMLGARGGYTTTDLHVRYVRPVTVESRVLRAEGKVVHAGSKVMTATGEVLDARGKLVAHGSCGCLVLNGGQQSTINSQP